MIKVDKGQHVKYFMRNGMVLEGIVDTDNSSQEAILKSLDGASFIIIHRPTEDILLTKVILQASSEKLEEERSPQIKESIKEKLQEVRHPTGDPDLDQLNIEQLRQLVREQDRQVIIQKRRQHFGEAGNSKQAVHYSSPFLSGRSAYKPGRLPNTPVALLNRKK